MNLRTEAARSVLHIRRAGDHRVALAASAAISAAKITASAAISDAPRESSRPGTGIPGVCRAALGLSAALACPHRDVLVLVPAVVPLVPANQADQPSLHGGHLPGHLKCRGTAPGRTEPDCACEQPEELQQPPCGLGGGRLDISPCQRVLRDEPADKPDSVGPPGGRTTTSGRAWGEALHRAPLSVYRSTRTAGRGARVALVRRLGWEPVELPVNPYWLRQNSCTARSAS
jgi:hypothetical protein